ncbi:general substrate transporter [Dacryopinax primogenitus]|uniref:General substrate transporter n=1 Tax=Dacryopinax primogenitus (strain DJM 731) TaxID=1858805 RepID=M5GBS6_DACPD|nr:general substrate transporter [Dacryopinax primogenitus]EJU05890.1 general substrate transporter [Dacryopinax primogenitus]
MANETSARRARASWKISLGLINTLSNYTNYYGLPATGSAGTGIVFAIFNVGQIAGALFIWLADWTGRKIPIFIGCVGVIIGTIITATAPTLGVFVGGRFLLSFFCTIATTSAPLYMIEIAPPLYRGTIAGLYNTLWYMGSIIATCAVFGAHRNLADRGELDWRLPLWLQMLCPGIVLLGIFFCPESPRWLIGKGRVEEARALLVKYHANGEENHPLVELEMQEMSEALAKEGLTSWRNLFDLRVLFNTPGWRYRIMLNIAFAWFGQFAGNNVISYYLPSMLRRIGVTDTDTQLLLNIIYAIVGWVFATGGARFLDTVGRRPMFLFSVGAMAICLAIVAGTAAGFVQTGSTSCSYASIFFVYLFGATFAISLTPMQPIYPGEVLTNDMRAKGMGVMQISSGVASFINTFAAPVVLNNFYAFFAFFDVFEFLFIYFLFVETKGRTLEELEVVFNSPNPRKASLAFAESSKRKEKGGVEEVA